MDSKDLKQIYHEQEFFKVKTIRRKNKRN